MTQPGLCKQLAWADKGGRGAHRQGSSRGLGKACRRAWRARHVCGVTKSSTTTTSHQVWDQTSHHTSNTLSLVSPSFLLCWYKQGECSTLFLRFDFHYIDLSSFRQALVCLSVISVKLLTFYGKIWFQTNHISSGQILRHRLMTTFHTDPILWHQYSSSGKYVPLFRQN